MSIVSINNFEKVSYSKTQIFKQYMLMMFFWSFQNFKFFNELNWWLVKIKSAKNAGRFNYKNKKFSIMKKTPKYCLSSCWNFNEICLNK